MITATIGAALVAAGQPAFAMTAGSEVLSAPVVVPAAGFSGLVASTSTGHLFFGSGAGVLVTDLTGRTLATLGGSGVTDVSASPTGKYLIAATSTPAGNSIEVFDSASLVTVATHALPADQCPVSVTGLGVDEIAYGYACDGQWGGVGVIGLLTAGAPRTTSGGSAFYNPLVRDIPGTRRFVVASVGLSPASIGIVDAVPTTLAVVADQRIETCSNLQDLAVSPDGGSVTPACGSPYVFNEYRLSDWRPSHLFPGTTYPQAAAYSPDGAYFAGGVNGIYWDDIWLSRVSGAGLASLVYSADVTPGTSYSTIAPRGVAFSDDGEKLFTVSVDSDGVSRLQVFAGRDSAGSAAAGILSLTGSPLINADGTVTLNGTLTSASGAPLAGQTVDVSRMSGYDGPYAAAVTAADGTFTTTLAVEGEGPVDFSASWTDSASGLSVTRVLATNVGYGNRTITSVSISEPAYVGTSATVSGSVRMSSGTPVAGATVVLRITNGATTSTRRVVTAADGNYAAGVPLGATGTLTIAASYAGNATHDPSSAESSVFVGKRSSTVNLRLTRATNLSARVAITLDGGHRNRTVALSVNGVVVARHNLRPLEVWRTTVRAARGAVITATYAGDDWWLESSATWS